MPKRQRQDTHWLEQMQWYQATIANQWDLVWKPDVNTTADLPANWNEIWDTRLVRNSGYAYQYTNNGWKKIAGGWWWETATWWDIEWNITDQTDLNNALNSKASTSNLKTINSQSIVWTWNIEIDWIAKSATAPENPQQWDVYYNTTDNVIYSYDGEQWKAVWGSGTEFNPNWYYPNLHAWLSDNLYTSDNIIDVDSWNFRTTAGSESVPSSGTASLNNIKWKLVRTVARTECIINPTATDGIFITGIDKYQTLYATNNTTGITTFTLTSWVWNTDPSTYWLTVELQQEELDIENWTFSDWTGTIFKSYVSTSRWTFTLRYDAENLIWSLSNWTDSWTDADTTTFWITTPVSTDDVVYISYYDECTDWSIELDFTAEVRWTLVYSAPAKLVATWVNQFDWTTIISSAEIDNWEIVAGSNYIVYVPAYGGVTNWYMAYCPDWYIVNCWWIDGLENTPNIWSEVKTTGNTVTSTSCSMPNAETGYFVVEVSASVDDTNISVHPKWSGQQDTNTDWYTTNAIDFPYLDTWSNPLPWYMANLWDVYDELNWQTQTYIKRIELISFDYSDLVTIANSWVAYDYDENSIYYVLETPTTYTVSFDNTYTANDYGTERILTWLDDLNPLAVEINTSYGSNLVDKLRTWVVTKEEYPQVITQTEYDNLPATKNTDGIIRFIYTEE